MMTYERMSGIHESLTTMDEDELWDLIDAIEDELARAVAFFKEPDDQIMFMGPNEHGKKAMLIMTVETAHFVLFDAELQLDRFDEDDDDDDEEDE